MDKNTQNSEPNKIRPRISLILDIALLVLGVISLAVSGVLVYQRVYLQPFFINGQSMYPTLNKDAVSEDGTLKGATGGNSVAGDKHLDYVVVDTHNKAINKIKRFDIAVCYYSESKSIQIIKRVIGLPGETIKFTSCESGDPQNGDLYVKQGDEFVLVEQPIENEYKCVTDSNHVYPSEEIVLGEDEYYVLGDNRNHSSDSRMVGKIKRDLMIGKVVAVCGYCQIRQGKNGENEPYKVKYFAWPRFFK